MKTPRAQKTLFHSHFFWRILALAAISGIVSGCKASSTSLITQSSGSASNSPGNTESNEGGHEVTISWAPASGTIEGYTVEYSTDGAHFTVVQTVPSSATSATVTGLASSTTYYFRVHASNSAGISGPSTRVSVTTPSTPAIAPASSSP